MIHLQKINKSFKSYHKPADRLKEILLRRPYHHSHQVLKDINLDLKQSQTLGVLGKNGAGKSTLLKIVTGVLLADSGKIEIEGTVTALLELGTGFDENITGQQNITNNALLIGMSKPEIQDKKQTIIDFSELGEYINEPLRTYSSGMIMRLAFSIAIHANPDIFIVDEALSVGDAHFQQKSMRKIKEFKQQGGSIIFVSHDLNAVKLLCDKVIVLDGGECVYQGTPEDGVNYYNKIISIANKQEQLLDKNYNDQTSDYGNLKAKIISAELIGENSQSNTISSGELANLAITLDSNQNIDDISIGIMIRDRFGQDIYGTNTNLLQHQLTTQINKTYQANFNILMNIAPGKYTLTIALHSLDNHIEDCYHWIDNMISFEVAGKMSGDFAGICNLKTQFELKEKI